MGTPKSFQSNLEQRQVILERSHVFLERTQEGRDGKWVHPLSFATQRVTGMDIRTSATKLASLAVQVPHLLTIKGCEAAPRSNVVTYQLAMPLSAA